MNRQKLSVYTLMCLLACAATACSSDLEQKEIPIQEEEGERITVTATGGMSQSQPSTRLVFDETTDANKLKLTWRPINRGAESFSVLSGADPGNPSTFTLESINQNDAQKASFTGEIAIKNEATYYALYPALSTNAPVAATAIPLDMTGQTGKALDENKVYMYGSSKYDSKTGLDFSFNHLASILKVTMKFPMSLSGEIASQVTFTAAGLYTNADADITASSATYNNQTTGSLVLSSTFTLSNDANIQTTVYLHVLPGTLTDFKVTATADGKSYTATISDKITIDPGKMYTKTVAMKDPLANAEVGDFYCKGIGNIGYLIPRDATLTEEQKKDCIGIVCWVGSEALNEDPLLNNDHPDCSHGLVVALEDASSTTMNWSKQSECVYDWVNTNATYSGVVNIRVIDKMCGYSNTLALMAYNKEKGNDYNVLPCDAILEYSKKKPAPKNSSGWYCPSYIELKNMCWGQGEISQGIIGREYLNTQIDNVGGTRFVSEYYWSSTESGSLTDRAWVINFDSGYYIYHDKIYYDYHVRPILAF